MRNFGFFKTTRKVSDEGGAKKMSKKGEDQLPGKLND